MMNEQLVNFHDDVVLKYHIYNSLFLTLPFGGTEETGTILSVFSKYCQDEIRTGKSPKEIIANFFSWHVNTQNESEIIVVLVMMLQFVERQILLFDALEDAAFSATHDLNGHGSLQHLIVKTVNANQQENFVKQLLDYQIKIVLTAHPTQFYPTAVLGIMTQLTNALRDNDLKQISQLLLQMGKTSFKHQQKPTPFEEAHSIVWYLEKIFYPVIPNIQREVDATLKNFGYQGERIANNIELGFWPGGDRDGNPFVTAATTLDVAHLLKTRILEMYFSDLRELVKKLTFAGVIEKLEKIRQKVKDTHLYSQLASTKKPKNTIYHTVQELMTDLEHLRKLLITKHNSLFLDSLDDFIIKVRCFGFYFSAMDMRENAYIHRKVFLTLMSELNKNKKMDPADKPRDDVAHPFDLSKYEHLSEKEKFAVLTMLINAKISYELPESHQNEQFFNTIQSMSIIKKVQDMNGEKGLCRYVISNTESMFDVLELLAMLNIVGNFQGNVSVDIIPLFESINDLENAALTMQKLYECDSYRQHLLKRNMTQVIMLGFSDGTKDGGYVSANWSIYQAKLKLTEMSKRCGIKVDFFDGRGGPPARGGGNTHLFYRSLGSKISHRHPQLTIQGQTISANFGTHDSAKYNIEQLFTAGLADLIFVDQTNDLSSDDMKLIENLSLESNKAYLALKNDPLFIEYLEQMTPLKFYGELNVGSRPAARKQTAHIQFSDLRAIPFVGSWSQLKQNIPGYYGFGAAIQKLISDGKIKKLQRLYQHSLFFRTLIENTMMSLSKTFFPLTEYMKIDKKFGEFWQKLFNEAQLTEKLLLEVSGQHHLLETDQLNRESIMLREEIVLPLLVIQQFALIRLQELSKRDLKFLLVYKKIILKALAANTNASRNAA